MAAELLDEALMAEFKGCKGAKCRFAKNRSKAHLMHHVANNIPTVISYDDLELMPERGDFIDRRIGAICENIIQNNDPLMFLPVSCCDKVDYVGGRKQSFIYYFGIIPSGEKVCLVIAPDIYVDIRVPLDNAANSVAAKVAEFRHTLGAIMTTGNIVYTKIDDIALFPLHGWVKNKLPYKRIRFPTLGDRKKFIDTVSRIQNEFGPYELSSDDSSGLNYYIQKIARERKYKLGDWCLISKYEKQDPRAKCCGCAYVLGVAETCIESITNTQKADILRQYPLFQTIWDTDPTLLGSWDIETYSPSDAAEIRDAEHDVYTIFMVNTNYYWHYSTKALMSVCCVDSEVNAREGISISVVCSTEIDLLMAHFTIMSKMRPDLFIAFNGANFDWPRVKHHMAQAGKLYFIDDCLSCLNTYKRPGAESEREVAIGKWQFTNLQIKISAEMNRSLACVANFPGMVDIDIMPLFERIYQKNERAAQRSLNYFLSMNDLQSKEDMPYKRMFRIYERAQKLKKAPKVCHCADMTSCECCAHWHPMLDNIRTGSDEMARQEYGNERLPQLLDEDGEPLCCHCGKRAVNEADMTDVAYYCAIDCSRPQELICKVGNLIDARGLSSRAYVTLYDSIYKAGGMKVRNLIGSLCYEEDVAFTNRTRNVSDSEKDHFPGAHVFTPQTGFYPDDGVSGLDFASLYPNEMQDNNLSTEMIVTDARLAKELLDEGYRLIPIGPFEIERGAEKHKTTNKKMTINAWTVHHNNVHINGKIVTKYDRRTEYTFPGGQYPPMTVENGAPTEEQQVIIDAADAAGVSYKRKDKFVPTFGRDAKQNERMGIFARGVKMLFDERLPIKHEKVALEELLEKMDKSGETVVTMKDGVVKTREEIVRLYVKVNAQQNALKLLSNTFYGESGNFRSGSYNVIVAGGVTTKGVHSIKSVYAFVMSERGLMKKFKHTNVRRLVDEAIIAGMAGEIDRLLAKPMDVEADYGIPERSWHSIEKYISETAQEARREDIINIFKKLYKSLITRFDNGYTFTNRVIYGDTDSLYICPPKALLMNAAVRCEIAQNLSTNRKEWLAARIEYWSQIVYITRGYMTTLRDEVNAFMVELTRNTFLNMAYEEVGLPFLFVGKKKYSMIPHINEPNFIFSGENPFDDIGADGKKRKEVKVFVKGIDIVKQGQAAITKQLGYSFLRELFSVDNTRDPMEIAKAKMNEFYNTRADPKLFALAARYKSHKKNVAVHSFVRRMRMMQERHQGNQAMMDLYAPPDDGDKFYFVIVKRPLEFTISGRVVSYDKGDLMEYVHVYLESQKGSNPLEIDAHYYIEHQVTGIFCRFIGYYDQFKIEGESEAVRDGNTNKRAKKYLNDYCGKMYGKNTDEVKALKKTYGQTYRDVRKRATGDIMETLPAHLAQLMIDLAPKNTVEQEKIDKSEAERAKLPHDRYTDVMERIKASAKEAADASINSSAYYVDAMLGFGYDITAIWRIHNRSDSAVVRAENVYIQSTERREISRLWKLMPDFTAINKKRDAREFNLIMDLKARADKKLTENDIKSINTFTEEEIAVINGVNECAATLGLVYQMRVNRTRILNEIESRKNKICGIGSSRPTRKVESTIDLVRRLVEH